MDLTQASDVRAPIDVDVEALHEAVCAMDAGEVATYIPELGKADPAWCGISLATVDGHIYEVGDSARTFSIQSISKPFVYALALQDHGVDAVLSHVGVEPSGDAFNAIVVDEGSQRPFNSMVNAGAIVTSALVKGSGLKERFGRIEDAFARFCGRRLKVDEAVFESERATGDRNRAIAWFMRSFDMLPGDVDQALDLYFRQCALLVTCRDLAAMAATLANRGVNPLTGQRALDEHLVPAVLSVMSTCGLYDFSGEWTYRVGLPAKSGVSGGVVAAMPGQLGVGVFSPPLDARGNSVRGIAVCDRLSSRFRLHQFDVQPAGVDVIRHAHSGLHVRSMRVRQAHDAEVLDRHGREIVTVELQGPLYFASAERAGRVVLDAARRARYFVLDCRRLSEVDDVGAELLSRTCATLASAGVAIVVAHVADALWGVISASGAEAIRRAEDQDTALEWCEDRLLESVDADRSDEVDDVLVDLADQDLLRDLDRASLAALAEVITTEQFPAGTTIFDEGDPAEAMYFIAKGAVSVQVRAPSGIRRRIVSMSAGAVFGDMAILDGGTRSGRVRADEDTDCFVLTVDALWEVRRTRPEAAVALYVGLARSLGERLRRANEEIRVFAED